HQFAALAVADGEGKVSALGTDLSETLWTHLMTSGYLDAKGKVQDVLKQALRDGTLDFPPEFEILRTAITETLRKACGRLEVRDADERRTIKLRTGKDGKAVVLSAEFRALWDRIKYKTTYRV